MHAGLRRTLVRGRDSARRAAWPLGSVVATRSGDRVVLTYDDGPDPRGTEPVLAALAEARVHATFFVLLTRVRRYPSLLDEVVAAGHEIGLHGVDHQPLTSFPVREVARRSTSGRAELEDRLSAPVRWFRPPYGALTTSRWVAVRSAGLMPVLWGPSSRDNTEATDAERRARAGAGRAGAIVLAHDGFAGPLDGVDDGPEPLVDRGALARATIAGYRATGLTAGSLGEVASASGVRRAAGFVR